ncbi:MAG: hypothetical protein ACD_20C00154G0002, partial [uncultured bacterium]
MNETYKKNPFLPYIETTIKEVLQYTRINKDITERLTAELGRRGYKDIEITLDNSDWRFFHK